MAQFRGDRAAQGQSLRKNQLTPEVLDGIRKLDRIASDRGQTLAEMALAWVLHDSRVTSVIVGCSSVAQLRDSIGAVHSKPFSSTELEAIDKVHLNLD